jgi:histone acetyltransferase (RNA polymerase elongator complex component)
VDRFLARCREPQNRSRILAFYGGSFTGIGKNLLGQYLEVASRLLACNRVHGVKASTRPDLVSPSVLDGLKKAGFVELELGIQSMDDRVLLDSGRGHTALDAVRASSLVRGYGMKLGIQIMPGLPGEDITSFRRTVEIVAGLGPDSVRVYPAVVLSGTKLEDLYAKGEYQPLTLEDAVARSLFALVRLEGIGGCSMLRMGLPPSPGLRITAGPYHDAFGFLVRSRGYRIMAQQVMDELGTDCELSVHPRDLPELLGYRRETVSDLRFHYSFDEKLPRGYLRGRSGRESSCIQLRDILEYIL